ncbi:hypothetical protein OpiT1DRAFT_05387 [Opitutaceae bacterium TAV1]|nr:hypothetical protein OpiT1DRAFT_05387 [Opitutaceae bacterium TAV1]
MKSTLRLTCFAALLTAFAGIAHARDYIDDTFDGLTGGTNPNTQGWYFYNSAPSALPWQINTIPGTSTWPVDSVHNFNDKALWIPKNDAIKNTLAFKQFATPFTFANIGDSLTVSLNFRTLANATGDGAFDIRLFDTGSAITANNFGGANPVANREGVRFRHALKSDSKSGFLYFNADGTTSPIAQQLAPVPAISIGDDSEHCIQLTLTLTIDGLNMKSWIDGTLSGEATQTGIVAGFTIDTLSLDAVTTGNAAYFDNIKVTGVTAIPEANAIWTALSVFVAVACVLCRHHASPRQ